MAPPDACLPSGPSEGAPSRALFQGCRIFPGVEIATPTRCDELVGAIAAEIGSPGVELREDGGVFHHHVFLPGGSAPASSRRVRRLWRELGGPRAARLRDFAEAERDWGLEGRRGFRGTRAGPFWIGPPWVEPPPDAVVVRINPGRAFGTGLHPTTRIALRLLAAEHALPVAGRSVLDLGVGSGVLALAALALGARDALGLDTDVQALANAAENRALNGAECRLGLAAGSLEALAPGRTFDVVLANLERPLLEPLLPALARLVSPTGRLVVSGILAGARESFLAAARRPGLRSRRRLGEAGWWGALLAHRAEPPR